MRRNTLSVLLVPVVAVFLSGCATNLTKPAVAPQPTTVKLAEFPRVEIMPVTVSEAFAENGANQRAARKINEMLVRDMKMVLPEVTVIPEGGSFTDSAERTLRIIPVVKEIKFIGGAARFWVGAWAGSSAILMQVDFVDSQSGEIIGHPQFYRDANAMAGAWSVGHSDNQMLEQVVHDIINYTTYNR